MGLTTKQTILKWLYHEKYLFYTLAGFVLTIRRLGRKYWKQLKCAKNDGTSPLKKVEKAGSIYLSSGLDTLLIFLKSKSFLVS